MKAKILFAGDLHKKMKDISTIRGYVKVANEIEQDLINILKTEGFTHFISLGDWYDRGYGGDVSSALAHTELDRELANAVNGNFYGVIGNHVKLQLDSNPELFLIQPHDSLKTRNAVPRDYQIIRTPRRVDIGKCSIYLQHWDPTIDSVVGYKPLLNPDANYHIGIFHCQEIIPTNYLHSVGIVDGTNHGIAETLEGINLAIVGHIHKDIGKFLIRKPDGTNTTMIVPGSLSNTDAGLISRHLSIKMPVVIIEDDDTVTVTDRPLDLRTDELTFYDKKFNTSEEVGTLRGNAKDNLYDVTDSITQIDQSQISMSMSLNGFMKAKNYTDGDKRIVKTILSTPEDTGKLINIFIGDRI